MSLPSPGGERPVNEVAATNSDGGHCKNDVRHALRLPPRFTFASNRNGAGHPSC